MNGLKSSKHAYIPITKQRGPINIQVQIWMPIVSSVALANKDMCPWLIAYEPPTSVKA